MYQLNYRSKSRPGLEIVDLDNILEKANAINSIRNITGCLIYHNKSFVQILEGKKKDVLHVFEKIKADERHHEITVLWQNKVDNRFFKEWNMAYYQPDDKNIKQYVNNLLLLSELSDRSSGSLLSFWATVRSVLHDGTINQNEKV